MSSFICCITSSRVLFSEDDDAAPKPPYAVEGRVVGIIEDKGGTSGRGGRRVRSKFTVTSCFWSPGPSNLRRNVFYPNCFSFNPLAPSHAFLFRVLSDSMLCFVLYFRIGLVEI